MADQLDARIEKAHADLADLFEVIAANIEKLDPTEPYTAAHALRAFLCQPGVRDGRDVRATLVAHAEALALLAAIVASEVESWVDTEP